MFRSAAHRKLHLKERFQNDFRFKKRQFRRTENSYIATRSFVSMRFSFVLFFQLLVGRTDTLLFSILNSGQTGLYFSWMVKGKFMEDVLKLVVKDLDGYVKSGDETATNVTLLPIRNFMEKNIKLKLQVRHYQVGGRRGSKNLF